MIEDFFHLPPVSTTPVVAQMVYSGAWGKLFMKKTRSQKSRDTVPLSKDDNEDRFFAHS